MKVLGIITARGGSKGIPGKNLVKVCGKSLLTYTAEAALQSKLSHVLISTDDSEIASEAKRLGVDVPFIRPADLAKDDTPTLPVLQDVVTRLEATGKKFDAIFTLQPTNPLRLTSDIDGAIDLLARTEADSVIGFSDVGERHPARMKTIDASGRVVEPPFAEQFEGQRRQDLPKYYLRDGSVYLTRRDVLMNQNSIKGHDCRAWLIPKERALNIDEPFDLVLCEFLLQQDISRYPGSPAGR
ncbi:MAG: acylneuraminate cytidylyltransferase family protein [Pirellulaceae bacterium]